MRELVLAMIAVLLVYLLWLLIRWWRLSRKQTATSSSIQFREPVLNSSILPADSDRASGTVSHSAHIDTLADEQDDDDAPQTNEAPTTYSKPRPPAEPDASAFGFDALLEVRQQRHLVDALRVEVDTLKQEIQQLRQDLADQRAASRVSPQYGEAVALARRGLDANAIAERCGISVSEAELVRSLLAMSPSGE